MKLIETITISVVINTYPTNNAIFLNLARCQCSFIFNSIVSYFLLRKICRNDSAIVVKLTTVMPILEPTNNGSPVSAERTADKAKILMIMNRDRIKTELVLGISGSISKALATLS